MKCSAWGCSTAASSKGGGVFCAKDWKRLPPHLQTPTREGVAVAIVHLAKLDGLLVMDTKPKAKIREQGRGSEYV